MLKNLMKQKSYLILTIIVFLVFSGTLCAQTSTQGTDFWLSFGRNGDYSSNDINMQVRIVSDQATTVTFTYTNSGTTYSFPVPAGSVETITLDPTERSRVFSGATGTTSNSLHIESTTPVSVYALNQRSASTDATNVLPVPSLGSDYYHISYRSIYNDGYIVIAIEDNTIIYDEGVQVATLQKGEVYSAYFGITDITGKHITSNNPIAYFTTNACVNVPVGSSYCDCLFQQLLPVNIWGNNFLVPVTHRGSERVRIVASQNGTVITQTGGVIKTDGGGQNSLTLNKGQFVELEIYLNSCGCYISADKPVSVGTYLKSEHSSPLLVTKGDPAFAWVPPIEQSITGALIAPFVPQGVSNLNEHYALVVTPTATKDQTTVAVGTSSPTAISGGSWCDNSASNYSFYSLKLSNNPGDSYFLANPNGLVVLGYGIGSVESYYYLSGAATRNLDAAFYINDIHYQDLDGGSICDTVADFRALIQYAMSSTPGFLTWYVDSVEQVAVTDTLEWSRTLSVGKHNVYIDVLDMNNDTVTLSTTFTVGASYNDTINDIICLGDRYQNAGFDTIPTQVGFLSYSQNLKTTIGCDSIITLNLTVNSIKTTILHDTICQTVNYNNYNFNLTNPVTDTYSDTLSTTFGCDSIVTLNLIVRHTYNDTIYTRICNNDSVLFGGKYYSIQNIYTDSLKTIFGCDSLSTLNLMVHPLFNDTIHVNIFMNDSILFGGNYYSTSGFYTDSLKTIFGCDSIVVLKLESLPINCPDGTVLFREDFGGNSPNDPVFSTTPLTQCSYTFGADGSPADGSGQGRYALRKYSFGSNTWYFDLSDHTSPNDITRGYLMQIDAAAVPGEFYKKRIDNLCQGSLLTLSVWGMSATRTSGWANGKIALVVEKTNGTEIARSNVELINQRGYWEQFSLPFSLPSGESSIVFRIINNSTTGAGNDFMLDDIEVRLCTPPVDVTMDNEVCEGSSTQFVGSFTNDGTFIEPLEYRWLKSATGDLTSQTSWTAIGSTSTLNITNVALSDSGFYRLAVASAGNIDLENCRAMSEPFYFSVNPKKYFVYSDTICSNQTYNFNGNSLNITGTYKDTITTVIGCDSIITLNLTVNPLFNDTIYMTICDNDSILFGGQYYSLQGSYTNSLSSVFGCDSLSTLNLTVRPTFNDTIYKTIYSNESVLFGGKYYSLQGIYTDSLKTVLGCDSLSTLHLTVHQAFDFKLIETGDICGDAFSFNIDFEELYGTVDFYSISFDAKTMAAGFSDITMASFTNPIIVNMPLNVRPDYYSMNITLENTAKYKQVFVVEFTVKYPSSVMAQKWNDVVALYNSAYNGGYDYSAIQWYKNGNILFGENYSHVYLENNIFTAGDEYSALLTRSDDGVSVLTCPLIVVVRALSAQVYPTILSAGETINIISPKSAKVSIYNSLGVISNSQNIGEGNNTITSPNSSGFYFMIISDEEQVLHKQTIVVK